MYCLFQVKYKWLYPYTCVYFICINIQWDVNSFVLNFFLVSFVSYKKIQQTLKFEVSVRKQKNDNMKSTSKTWKIWFMYSSMLKCETIVGTKKY